MKARTHYVLVASIGALLLSACTSPSRGPAKKDVTSAHGVVESPETLQPETCPVMYNYDLGVEEYCKLLAEEGLGVEGGARSDEFEGYHEALDAVASAINDMVRRSAPTVKAKTVAQIMDTARSVVHMQIIRSIDVLSYPEYVGAFASPFELRNKNQRHYCVQACSDAEGLPILLHLEAVDGKWRARRIDARADSPLRTYAPDCIPIAIQLEAMCHIEDLLWSAVQ